VYRLHQVVRTHTITCDLGVCACWNLLEQRAMLARFLKVVYQCSYSSHLPFLSFIISMPANQHPTTCFVCAYIAKREHSALVPPSEALQLCLLCNRNYCNEHRGEDEGVCENNNKTYWTRHHMDSPDIYPSLAARELAMKQVRTWPVATRRHTDNLHREKIRRSRKRLATTASEHVLYPIRKTRRHREQL